MGHAKYYCYCGHLDFYKNQRRWLINPAQKYLRVDTAYGLPDNDPAIEKFFQKGLKEGSISDMDNKYFKQWRVYSAGLPHIWEFIEQLKKPDRLTVVDSEGRRHPRHFTGDIRQIALEQFEKGGRFCKGVSNKSKPHKLKKNDRIEFDHIAPYTKGGANTFKNLQILCVECNRLKGASAA